MSILLGNLSQGTDNSYKVYLKQNKKENTWVLLQDKNIVAVLKVFFIQGKTEGYGDTNILSKLLSILKSTQADALASAKDFAISKDGTTKKLSYSNNDFTFEAIFNGMQYEYLLLSNGDYYLKIDTQVRSLPVKMPELLPVMDNRNKEVLIANLGLKTAAEAKIRFNLSWYEKDNVKQKDYQSIKTNEEFKQMMKAYLTSVVKNEKEGKVTLTGVDTETTGLMTVFLSKNNPLRDHIVAIPFAWEDNKAYTIFVRMEYFSNVDIDCIQELFTTIFSRPPDFGDREITISIDDETFHFHRNSILTTGHNTIFDTRTFLTDGIDFFFDEDTMQLGFNLATDWSKGKNSLKAWTRRFFKHTTLELEDLYGKAHKDKYGYLEDEELALIYGCADADYSRLIFKELRLLTENNLYYQYKKYDICLMHLYAGAEANGMPINTEEVRKLGLKVKEDIETLKTFVYRYAYKAIRSTNFDKMIQAVSDTLSNKDKTDLKQQCEKADAEQEYRFRFVAGELKTLLYNVLHYPILKISEKSQEPCLDKFVLKKLMSHKLDTPRKALESDILSAQDGSILISAKDFNMDKYPLARVLSKYGELNKEYTAYYKPIVENNLEGKMFQSFRTTSAATRRIINPLQTAKKELKKYYIAPPGKIFCSFDASQIEYRHMASLAYILIKNKYQKHYPNEWQKRLAATPIANIVKMMHDSERDYHIETAAMLNKIKQHLVTPKLRKEAKSVGFGIPYGLGVRSLCETMYGNITKENLKATQELLNVYYERQSEIIEMLTEARDSAFIPYAITDKFREVLSIDGQDDTDFDPEYVKQNPVQVGLVRNFTGFYRLFILKDLTRSNTASIRRKAGNCKIQGGAAELFRRMQYRFYMGCVEAGIQDKIQWLVNVHDELDFLVDDDIDILKLIEVLYKSCTLCYKDHIPYYIGINFGSNWADAKDDAAELPVIMVQRLIKEYHEKGFRIPNDGNQVDTLLRLKTDYLAQRIYEEITRVLPEFLKTHIIDLEKLNDKFTNYMVRSYLSSLVPKTVSNEYKKKKEDIPFKELLSYWALFYFKEKSSNILAKEGDTLEPLVTSNNIAAYKESDDIAELLSFDVDELMQSFDDNEQISIPFGEEVFSDEDSTYTPFDDTKWVDSNYEDDIFEENISATNYYDLLKPKSYIRKFIVSPNGKDFSVILTTAKTNVTERQILQYISTNRAKGEGTLTIIGKRITKIKNISIEPEFLDNLDKLIGGDEK